MRGLYFLADPFGKLWKYLRHHIVRGKAVGVLLFKILFSNNPVRVDIEVSWQSHALRHACGLLVQHTITGDNLRLRIGQQRKLDLAAVCKVPKDCRAVIADSSQLNSLRFEFLFRVLQLHELRFSERSPIRRTEEQKHGSVCPFQRIAGYVFAELVAGRKGRHLLAHVRPSQPSRARGGRFVGPATKRQQAQGKHENLNRSCFQCVVSWPFGFAFGSVLTKCTKFQICSSDSTLPKAAMPLRRTPFFTIQKSSRSE